LQQRVHDRSFASTACKKMGATPLGRPPKKRVENMVRLASIMLVSIGRFRPGLSYAGSGVRKDRPPTTNQQFHSIRPGLAPS
jgi:hypothetical protein